MKDITCCIMSCGESSEIECLKSIEPFLEQGAVLQRVVNVFPQIKALNQMVDQCNTRWLIPVDADMVLHSDAYYRIKLAIDKYSHDERWHTILFKLWDTLTEQSILALKIFRVSILKQYPFFDSPTPDVGHFKLLTDAGFTCITKYLERQPIGNHIVKDPYFCYHKYRDVYMTLRMYNKEWDSNVFKGGRTLLEKAKNHYNFFLYKYILTNNLDYMYCIAGMVDGLISDQENFSKSLEKIPYTIQVETAIDIFIDWYENKSSYYLDLF